MKKAYLEELRVLLNQYVMEEQEKEEILNDYNDMYDNYKDYGMSEREIREKLGEPSVIINDLTEGFMRQSDIAQQAKESRNTKITALSPFIALVLFFVLGFAFDLWIYSWMAFLLIPIVAIVVNVGPKRETMIALTPFVAVIGYGVLGFVFNYWHPGWLIFLLIPVTAILLNVSKEGVLTTLTALSPFAALLIFFLYFAERGEYIPGWLIFMIIPAIGALNEKSVLRIILYEALIIGGVVGYLYIGDAFDRYDLALLAFVPLVGYSLLSVDGGFIVMPKEYRLILLAAIVVYVLLGLASPLVGINLWGWAWLVFFSIPVYAIHKEVSGNEKVIAFMPFVSTFLFFTLGYFFGWWAFSWLAFLLIPVVAIIKEA